MPHKRNPISAETLTGLSRVLRGNLQSGLQNVALWHERDISHSSVERLIGPDATITLDFALYRLAGLVEQLVIYPEHIQRNLDKLGGLIFSQRVLLALTQKGMSREASYEAVQRNAMKVWLEGANFLHELQNDADVKNLLSTDELCALFDLRYHTKHVDTIFARVFG
jgi:adenylosuccinate lyase